MSFGHFGYIVENLEMDTTVQSGYLHPVHRCLTGKPQAERPKSRRGSGQIIPYLQFLCFGRLFQFMDTIFVDKRPFSKGKSRLNIQWLSRSVPEIINAQVLSEANVLVLISAD